MKKIVLMLITLMPFLFRCNAQDTVQYGDPCYLFNTRFPFCYDNPDAPVVGWWLPIHTWSEACTRDHFVGQDVLSRYTIPGNNDRVLVYGVAATFYTGDRDIEKYNYLVTLAKIENGSIIFIDSTRWTEGRDVVQHFKYAMTGADGNYYEHIVPVYEHYFEEPHLLTDTFFVGHYHPIDADLYLRYNLSLDSMSSFWIEDAHKDNYILWQNHGNFRRYWGGVFPIIQPNRYCNVPEKPRAIVYTTTNTVQFQLPYDEGDSMTLSIARVGQFPDSGDLYNVTDSVMSVVLPDSGHYEARLRRYCARYGDYLASSWSAAFPILITTPLGITANDGSPRFAVTPNPAVGKVEVDCNVAEGTLTLLDMQGRTLSEMPSSQRVIDVSGLAAGTYMLRLTAPDIAPAVRKLIVAQP